MSFNIWLGGDVVDFGKVVETIEASGAEVVGLQEAEGNTRKVARALGWPYWSDRLHVVSRHPLIDPPEARGEYVLVQLRPGEVFALANVHLTSDPYGPYAVRDGRSLARVLNLERSTRLPEIRATLRALPDGIPTLMTGDFNTPSHLDWTAAVDAVRDDVRYPVPWPVTEALAAAGFQDTYRAVHPDPVASPGITWTYGYPFPRLNADEVVDRIDLVQASAGIQVLDSGIAGPPGTPDVTIPIDPYPSDHRAVVSTVRLTPVAPRPFASVLHRRVTRGDDIGVRYAAPRGEGRDHLAIARGRQGDHDAPAAGGELLRPRHLRLRRPAAGALRGAAREPWPRALTERLLGRRARRAAERPRARREDLVAQRAGLPPRLDRHLEGRRHRPLQRLPRVRLHGRQRGGRHDHQRPEARPLRRPPHEGRRLRRARAHPLQGRSLVA